MRVRVRVRVMKERGESMRVRVRVRVRVMKERGESMRESLSLKLILTLTLIGGRVTNKR